MEECTRCKNEFNDLEDWGFSKLCPTCVEAYKQKYPNRKRRGDGELKIMRPTLGAVGAYNPKLGEIELYRASAETSVIEETINHEFVHFLLHRMIGLRVCYQFDNVWDVVDPYHSFE